MTESAKDSGHYPVEHAKAHEYGAAARDETPT